MGQGVDTQHEPGDPQAPRLQTTLEMRSYGLTVTLI